jgi:hypothetical protein
MRRLKVGAGLTAALLLPAVATPAMARERLAVLIVAEEAALADDLTEVAIAELAERRDRELVGMRELRGRLTGVLPAAGLGACLEQPDCLARVGAAAGAELAVIGRLRRSGEGHLLDLSLADTRSAEIRARVSAAVPAGMDRLVAAVRQGVQQLFAPDVAAPVPAPAAPVAAIPPAAVAPAAAPAAAAPLLATKPAAVARPGAWLPYAGVAATALAAVSFSAAAVTGTIAMEEPVGSTRAIAQYDLERRKDYATTANALLLTGTLLSAAAGTAFVWWWRGGRTH